MNIPDELLYTSEHEWIAIEQDTATIGITDYAQSELGDIVFVELPSEGEQTEQGEPFGTIEAVKAVSELFAPLTGVIVETNGALEDQPELVNSDPYGEGWIIKLKFSSDDALSNLLPADQYRAQIA